MYLLRGHLPGKVRVEPDLRSSCSEKPSHRNETQVRQMPGAAQLMQILPWLQPSREQHRLRRLGHPNSVGRLRCKSDYNVLNNKYEWTRNVTLLSLCSSGHNGVHRYRAGVLVPPAYPNMQRRAIMKMYYNLCRRYVHSTMKDKGWPEKNKRITKMRQHARNYVDLLP